MDPRSFPTKGNLILAKNSLTLARQGYELMDKKRNILIREMKAHGVSVPYKAMVTEHNIGWTLSDLFTELVREHEAMHQ